MDRNWHQMSIDEVFTVLGSTDRGLKSEEACRRIGIYGPNALREEKKEPAWLRFLGQFKDFLVLILLASTVISFLVGETKDAVVILVIVVLNATLGFIQERKAEKAMEALRRMASLKALVIRDGERHEIDASQLVPGDLVLIQAGDKIPSDARLIESVSLMVDESALTGESIPREKTSAPLKPSLEPAPISDRDNMIFTSTHATYGRGKAITVSTGMQTEIGKIAHLIQTAPTKHTPLQLRLEEFGKRLGLLIIGISIIVFLLEISRGEQLLETFVTSVSLAVAAIPEGLPAMITAALALGMQRMARRNAIVRKLHAVETLGSTTAICSDKTGTLTKNEMTIRQLYVDGSEVSVTGEGYAPIGTFLEGEEPVTSPSEGARLLLEIGTLCNDAKLEQSKSGDKLGRIMWRVVGDPTEGALIVAAKKAGIDVEDLHMRYPRVDEHPFSSERKRMTTVHSRPDKTWMAYMKGAPEVVIDLCTKIMEYGAVRTLTQAEKDILKSEAHGMAENALRVLGFAYKPTEETLADIPADEFEKDFIFVGLCGMMDPPREEAERAVNTCREAGIEVVMITGDHEVTATAIAKELKIMKEGAATLSGARLDKLSENDLEQLARTVYVYARVSPHHKLKIVSALKKNGHNVAMTGDGVNDAPALKTADIGIAMGMTGTDVAKEASDMILVDDNFATIVSAVEEGRAIFANIKKFIFFLLSTNSGEVMLMLAAALLGLKLPVIAIQILLVNLVTDGLPALALGVEPPEPDLMKRPPRGPKEEIITMKTLRGIFAVGLLMCIGTLGAFLWGRPDVDLEKARTISFTTLVMFQLFHVFNCRSERHSILDIGPSRNKYLLLAVASSITIQLAVVYLPFLQNVFSTEPLSAMDWLVIVAISGSILLAGEIVKRIYPIVESPKTESQTRRIQH